MTNPGESIRTKKWNAVPIALHSIFENQYAYTAHQRDNFTNKGKRRFQCM